MVIDQDEEYVVRPLIMSTCIVSHRPWISLSSVDKYPVAKRLNETQDQSAIQLEVLCLSIESFLDTI